MSVVQTKKLLFTPKAWIQMWRLTEACDIEISALGLLLPGRDDVVQEFYVPKQKCSGVYTEMDDQSLSLLQLELINQGADTSRLRVFFHSHVNMTASPSGTDEATIDRLANGAFMWSIITNKSGAAAALAGKDPGNNLYLRLDTYDPNSHGNNNSVYRNTVVNCSYGVLYQGTVTNKWIEESLAKVERMHNVVTVQKQSFTAPVTRTWQAGVQTNLPVKTKLHDDDDDFPAWWGWQGTRNVPPVRFIEEPAKAKKIEERQVKTESTVINVEKKPETIRDNIGYWTRKWLSS
jgi:hypothetical protein